MKEALTFLWIIKFTKLDLVVTTVALGSASMICLLFFGSESESEPAYDLEAFTSATND
jgi:hypothetical protein